jgi:hypothetical protein
MVTLSAEQRRAPPVNESRRRIEFDGAIQELERVGKAPEPRVHVAGDHRNECRVGLEVHAATRLTNRVVALAQPGQQCSARAD